MRSRHHVAASDIRTGQVRTGPAEDALPCHHARLLDGARTVVVPQ